MKKNTAPEMVAKSYIAVKNSKIHGRGVFVKKEIPKGAAIIEYVGERISWKEALRRHPHDPNQPNHTFYFSLKGGGVIDAKVGGNAARWINHSCTPNCEVEEIKIDGVGRVFIYAKRNLMPGEELFYDYSLSLDEKPTKKLREEYRCHCGSKKCRGTMLDLD
jgi:SET domain-containing protein